MADIVPLGKLNILKDSKLHTCRCQRFVITGTGNIVQSAPVPSKKLWIIQQISLWNSEAGSRTGYFYIQNDSGTVGFIPVEGKTLWTCVNGQGIGMIGSGLQYIPENWILSVSINGLTNSGGVFWYLHMTEVDLE